MKGSEILFINTKIKDESGKIYIFGRLENGKSICAKTESFSHYFYASMGNDELNVELLNSQIHEASRQSEESGNYIKSVEVVERTSIMGYQPNGAVKMYKIYTNYVTMARKIIEQKNYLTYEASIQMVIRFMVDKQFGGFHWLKLSEYSHSDKRESRCDIEVDFKDYHLSCVPERMDFAPVVWLSFDIEACKGGNGRGFVNAKEDSVSQIGCTLFTSDYKILDKRCFSLVPKGKAVTPIGDVAIETFEDEKTLLQTFRDYVNNRDVDVITGYNIKGFDIQYLFDRAAALNISKDFLDLGKLINKKATIRKSTFSSAQKGSKITYNVKIDGRFVFDVLDFIKDTQKLRSYTLGNVAFTILGYAKVEMPYENIPIYQAGTDDQRAHLCYYCWWDAHLCYEIIQKQMAIVNSVETARVCGVPLDYLLDRGQQILTTSLLLRFGNARNFVIPSSTENQNDEKTKGAFVLDPKKGFYRVYIIVLDFRSLYPSIIDDSNMCYSTIVPIAWAKKNLKEVDYTIPPIDGIDYCFVKSHIQVGILAQMEQVLFAKRMEAKADLKKEKDPAKKAVLDGRQNAIKVRMNSIYGYLKANTVCDKRLMEAVTGTGRWMLETSKNLVESNFPGSQIIYGDSVTGDTPCILFDKTSKSVIIKTIDTIANSDFIVGIDGKEYASTNYLVWTEDGWTKINRIIRHYTDKEIVRVLTNTGVVDCTTDHGLIRKNGERVASGDLKIGDELLHSFIFEEEEFGTNSSKFYRITNKLDALKTYTYLRSLGYFVYINVVEDVYIFDAVTIQRKEEFKIKKIINLKQTKQYVYDLETENHHFHAGVGQMIVHNTDSIFVNFGDVSLEQAYDLGQRAADLCTEFFTRGKPRKVHLLQREKAMNPLLMIGKKKYTGFKSLGPGLPFERSETGLENVRRDNAKIGSETLDKVADLIIVEKDFDGKRSIEYVHHQIQSLLLGQIEISKLIISKNLSKSFEHYEKKGTKQPHVELAKRIAARTHQTGENIYYTGDRVPFVMIAGLKNSKTSERAEDPLFALKNRLPIDYDYYIENQMMKPIMRLMIPLLAPHESMTKRNKSGKKVYLPDKEMRELTTYKILFTGPHMMSKIQKTIEGGLGIMKFIKKEAGCKSCGARLRIKRNRDNEIIASEFCDECEDRKAITYLKMQTELNQLETKRWACWTACQACVGEKYAQKIDCRNKDCDNFYEREKIVLDIEDLYKKL